MGVGRQVQPTGGQRRLELGRPVAPIAQGVDDFVDIGQEVQTDRGVGTQSLVEREVTCLAAELAPLQSLEFGIGGVIVIGPGVEALHPIDDQVWIDEREGRIARSLICGLVSLVLAAHVHRHPANGPIEHRRQFADADRLAIVLATGAATLDRPAKRSARRRLVVDRIEVDPLAIARVPGSDRACRPIGAPRVGLVSVREGAGGPRLVDQRELPLGRRQGLDLGIDRFGFRHAGQERRRALADRNDLQRRFPFGVKTEEFRHGPVREGGDDLGPVVERVGDREQVRDRRPRVPEGVAKGSFLVLPGVSPPRRGGDDRERGVRDAVVARGRGEDTPVVALAEHVQRQRARIEVVDAGLECRAVSGVVSLAEVATDHVEIDVVQRPGRRRGPEQQAPAAPIDRLRDPRGVVTERRHRLEIRIVSPIGVELVGSRYLAVRRRLRDRRECGLLGRAEPIGERPRRQVHVLLVRPRLVVEVQAVASLANASRRVFRPFVVLAGADCHGW